MAQRVGVKAFSSYICVCGKPIDARDLHGLSCRELWHDTSVTPWLMTSLEERWNGSKFLPTKNQRVLFYRMVNDRIEPHLYNGLRARRWRGMSRSLTHMRHRTYSQHPPRYAMQPSMQQGQRSPNTMSWVLHISSIQSSLKQTDLGTYKQWS